MQRAFASGWEADQGAGSRRHGPRLFFRVAVTYLELNLITASRSLLCPVIWFGCWWRRPRRMVLWMTLAFAYFLVTDHFDGQWARAYGLVSEFGYWLDHIGDFAFYGVVALTIMKGPREPEVRRRAKVRPTPSGPTSPPEPDGRPPS